MLKNLFNKFPQLPIKVDVVKDFILRVKNNFLLKNISDQYMVFGFADFSGIC